MTNLLSHTNNHTVELMQQQHTLMPLALSDDLQLQPTQPESLLPSILLMAVPKNRRTYPRKRVRQGAHIRERGPKPQHHLSQCPVCERMRMPHRVCEREDCETYFVHRWL